jgi:hypothetical protein
MRTKTLLAAAAIVAAGLASSMAQSNVYSLNVVGYVNKPYVAGFNAGSNPLNAPTNDLNHIMVGSQVPDNTILFLWNTTLQDFDPSLPTYISGSSSWSPNATLNPGTGFFLLAPSAFTNTFVGEVKQGLTTVVISPGFNGIGSPVPIGGSISNVLAQMPALDNDLAFQWDTVTQDFGAIATYVGASSTWSPNVNFSVGEGIFYLYGGGAPANWNRTFTVQ